ncbi:hypothetical protein Bca4012_032955 [Brassica carinata]|uniref:Uncharacterized protein n=1 Tax=Brassica carinata TaxID=52824 RepID=A0A8X7UNQ5_BRACI|nr:hypothetical protein Bca52824_046089 [Brassica carinata]
MTTITTLNGRITGPISRSLLTWLLPPRSSSTTSANSTNATWKYLEDPCVWVESNTTTLNILSSQAEIAIGFLLITSLFAYALSSFQKRYN